MHSSSIVIFATALLAPLAAAGTDFKCTPSVNGYGINSAKTDAEDFCSTAQRENSTLLEKTYGVPYITFRFSGQHELKECSANDCIDAYTSMFRHCQYNNNTIWGTAQVQSSCATYNYTIGNATSPFLTANSTNTTNTTITPSPTGNSNGITAPQSTNGVGLATASGSLMIGVAGLFIYLL